MLRDRIRSYSSEYFFSFEIEQIYTLTTFVDHKLSLSQSILSRRMIILGDPGAVSRVGKKGGTKVLK